MNFEPGERSARSCPGRHPNALGGERPGDGQADALGRAGDDGDLAGQIQVHDAPTGEAISAVRGTFHPLRRKLAVLP